MQEKINNVLTKIDLINNPYFVNLKNGNFQKIIGNFFNKDQYIKFM